MVNSVYRSPSFIGWGSYGLLSYELPLDKWLGDMRLIPFVLYEYNSYDDTRPFISQQFLIAGSVSYVYRRDYQEGVCKILLVVPAPSLGQSSSPWLRATAARSGW